MTDGHHVLLFVEVAGGIILGFVIWSYVGPMIFTTPAATPGT